MVSRPNTPFRQHARTLIFLGIVLVPLVPYLTVLILSAVFFVNSSLRSSQEVMRRPSRA